MCIDLWFSTPREVYVSGSHALFVRQSLILTAGVVIEIMISYYLYIYLVSEKNCRNVAHNYCLKPDIFIKGQGGWSLWEISPRRAKIYKCGYGI